MPAIDLASADAQIAHATKRLGELQAEVAAFARSNPYEIYTQLDQSTGRTSVRLRGTDPVPRIVNMLTGEVIHALRVPLDYLVCRLALRSGNDTKNVMFPFGKDAVDYEDQAKGKLKKLDSASRSFIDALEPYQGGKGQSLALLHSLDVGHKHLDLVSLGKQARTAKIGFNAGAGVRIDRIPMNPEPLEESRELMSIAPGGGFDGNIAIEVSVGFGAGSPPGDIFMVLSHFRQTVSQVIAEAKAAFV